MLKHVGPLRGLRVVDFTFLLAGAGATKILAVLGAQVLRIEDREGMRDAIRRGDPSLGPSPNLGVAWNNHNINKLDVTMDMKSPRAIDLVRRLVAVSDVVCDNFSRGVTKRWGLGYEDLVKIRPDIICLNAPGFGDTGAYRDYRSVGPVVQAMSGLTFLSGLADKPPAGWGWSYMDHTDAYYFAMAVLLALHHRNMTGQGQWIDLSQTDAAATLLGTHILDYTVNGRPSRRPGYPPGNHQPWPPVAPHAIYRCKGDDRWVAISVSTEEEWRALCGVMGDPEWAREPRFATMGARVEHQDDLDRLIEEWTRPQYNHAVMHRLQAAGIAAGMVQDPRDRIDHDPVTRAWDLFPSVYHPEAGYKRVDGVPIRFSESPIELERHSPLLGQDSDWILANILGLPQAEIDGLRRDAVV